MSFTTWNNYGYGICVSDLGEVPVERLRLLLEHAPDFHKEVDAWFVENDIENPTYDDYVAFDDEYMTGLATILSHMIEEAEQIHFTACNDFDGNDFLIYMPSYPWELPDSEHDLTEERIENILITYVSILTDDPISIDYQSVENGG